MKGGEMLIFLSIKNNSVTIGLDFLLAFVSVIKSSKTINTFLFFFGLYGKDFSKRLDFEAINISS